jgi:hypothetical protein
MIVDFDGSIPFPITDVPTTDRPDIVIYSVKRRIVIWGELTVPNEERIKASAIKKIAKYQSLASALSLKQWTVHDMTFEVGSIGFLGHSVRTFLSKLGFTKELNCMLHKMARSARRSSFYIWNARHSRIWSPPSLFEWTPSVAFPSSQHPIIVPAPQSHPLSPALVVPNPAPNLPIRIPPLVSSNFDPFFIRVPDLNPAVESQSMDQSRSGSPSRGCYRDPRFNAFAHLFKAWKAPLPPHDYVGGVPFGAIRNRVWRRKGFNEMPGVFPDFITKSKHDSPPVPPFCLQPSNPTFCHANTHFSPEDHLQINFERDLQPEQTTRFEHPFTRPETFLRRSPWNL